MVVDGDRQHLLGALLADDVLVEDVLDFLRLGQLVVARIAGILELFANDVVTEFDAFVADEDRGARNQLADLVLRLATKGAIQEFAVLVLSARIIAHTLSASVSKKISLLRARSRTGCVYNMRSFEVQSARPRI